MILVFLPKPKFQNSNKMRYNRTETEWEAEKRAERRERGRKEKEREVNERRERDPYILYIERDREREREKERKRERCLPGAQCVRVHRQSVRGGQHRQRHAGEQPFEGRSQALLDVQDQEHARTISVHGHAHIDACTHT